MNLTYFLITIFLILNYIFCYKNYTIEDDDICSLLDVKRNIYLAEGGNEGLVVTHSRLNDHSNDWNFDHACKFQVKMGTSLNFQKPNKFGIAAVIQSLSLRQNKLTGECIDWVQFKTKYLASDRYCGQVSLDLDGNMIHMMDKHGKIDTHIFIHRRKLEADENIDLVLVYTPFKLCTNSYESYFKCTNNVSSTALCMRDNFKNDSYTNCPNCFDEGDDNCRFKTKHSSGVGTIATVGAVLSLIISFVFFLTCVWICKRFNLFCWSHTFAAGGSGGSRLSQQNNVEMNLQGNTIAAAPVGGVSITNTPSAPPLSVDKDLPPPYESLFPDRSGDR